MKKSMQSRAKIIQLFFLLAGILLVGCAGILPPRSDKALYQAYNGHYREAWDMISAEMRYPTVSSPEGLCQNHSVHLNILSQIMRHNFAPADADRIAADTYHYMIDNCQDFPEKVVSAEHSYGAYFQNTMRPGLAVAHIENGIKLSPPGGFVHMIFTADLGTIYGDMGKFDLWDYHFRKAIAIGKKYLETQRSYKYGADERSEWRSYMIILLNHLDFLSWQTDAQKNLPEMRRLWQEIKAINQKWFNKWVNFSTYVKVIQNFAIAGDTGFARKLMEEAEVLARRLYSQKDGTQLDLQVAKARILEAEEKYSEAAELRDDWVERFKQITGKNIGANSYRNAGLAHEAAGNYERGIFYLEKALQEYEKMRSSLKVRSRTQVLSGLILATYWGLLRCAAEQYIISRDPADFNYALQIARLLRARQFGELLGIDDQLRFGFNANQLKLAANEILINIVITDKAMVIFELSAQLQDLKLIRIKGDELNKILQRAKSKLGDPGSMHDPTPDLLQLSDIIIAPIRQQIARYDRIIVIPDGYLNGIPFTILSKSSKQFLPLIFSHEIVLTPSLSYLVNQRNTAHVKRSNKLFALADPVFGQRQTPRGYRADTKIYYTQAVEAFALFNALPETRDEVNNISGFFNPGEVVKVFGFHASETHLQSLQLEDYRYLHFATHGVLGNQIPGIDQPALVLSKEPPNSSNDGFLTMGEVEELKISSDLTVLSACDTGSGEYFTGEGIMGLSRGFLLAGSRSVIVSLWPVSSHTTVDLMTEFYRQLKSEKSEAESLRQAQLMLIRNSKNNKTSLRSLKVVDPNRKISNILHPFYWAPFVIIGG